MLNFEKLIKNKIVGCAFKLIFEIIINVAIETA